MSRRHLTRLEIVELEEVLPLIHASQAEAPLRKRDRKIIQTIRGHQAKVYSLRLRTFLKSTKCAHCGLEATHFALEQQFDQDRSHLNLYAVTPGDDMLFTCDHIIPLSRDGEDNIDNTQTLCCRCNYRKGNKLESEL